LLLALLAGALAAVDEVAADEPPAGALPVEEPPELQAIKEKHIVRDIANAKNFFIKISPFCNIALLSIDDVLMHVEAQILYRTYKYLANVLKIVSAI
jgi:hypothetical protein